MEDIKDWESKFQPCEYSDKLLNLIAELNKTAIVPANILEVKKACYYARKYHGDQKRKSGEPYYSHPFEVCYLLSDYTGREDWRHYTTDLIIIAILHDTIEDTTLTKDMIAKIFNHMIAEGVQDLTNIKDGVKTTAAHTVDLLYSQGKEDILLIKMFDRLHNIMTIDAMSPEKKKKTSKETLEDFIIFSMNYELDEMTQKLVKLCYQQLKVKD